MKVGRGRALQRIELHIVPELQDLSTSDSWIDAELLANPCEPRDVAWPASVIWLAPTPEVIRTYLFGEDLGQNG